MKNSPNLVIVLLLLVVLGCSCTKLGELINKDSSSTPRPTPATTSTPPATAEKGDYDITMAKFDQLKIGMARPDVERILGGNGTEISSSVGGGIRFSVNKWEGEKFKSIILSFKNDKIMSKSQVGLK